MKKYLTSIVLFILKYSAILQLKKNRPLIIGVTGSAGKSSTVQAIETVLKKDFKVFATKKGNSETGIPMEILGIPVKNYQGLEWIKVSIQAIWGVIFYKPDYQILIVEMGIDSDQSPKNMDYLLSFLKPQIGVLLNANSVHYSNFQPSDDPIQSVADEKSKLLQSISEGGLAIYSLDYPQIQKANENKIKAQQATVSNHLNKATIFLEEYQISIDQTSFFFNFNDKNYKLQFKNSLHIKNSFSSFASAILIADHFGLDVNQSIKLLAENYKILPGRMSLFQGIHNSHIIDSSYNSSLEPTLESLNVLKVIKVDGKKIAILGDMRELGDQAKNDHQQIAQKISQTADQVILVGPLMAKYVLPILDKNKIKVTSVKTAWQAIPIAKEVIKKGDLVLVKGSQNTILLEIVVKEILKNKTDVTRLCRRSKFWEEQRNKLRSL